LNRCSTEGGKQEKPGGGDHKKKTRSKKSLSKTNEVIIGRRLGPFRNRGKRTQPNLSKAANQKKEG